MYFRSILESAKPTYYMSNSSGQVVAVLTKQSDDSNSWRISTGPKKSEKIEAENLTLEEAMIKAELLEV